MSNNAVRGLGDVHGDPSTGSFAGIPALLAGLPGSLTSGSAK